ncbi:hypothetical protein SNE510_75580 [Streptomyces sp. NE5-10]|nr:hypothetical protein SNE510_75580 [Streptomyces sp. NE5-10]
MTNRSRALAEPATLSIPPPPRSEKASASGARPQAEQRSRPRHRQPRTNTAPPLLRDSWVTEEPYRAVSATTCHAHAATDAQAEVPNPPVRRAAGTRGAPLPWSEAERAAGLSVSGDGGPRRGLRAAAPHRFQSAGTAERGILTVPADWPDTKGRPATARP